MSYSDSLLHFLSTDPPSTTSREQDRQLLAKQIEEFTRNGGKITLEPIRDGVYERKRTIQESRRQIKEATWKRRQWSKGQVI